MTGDVPRDEQLSISVDGAWFALVDGEWQQVRSPNPLRAVTPLAVPGGDFEEGPVSVDGAWFVRVEGEWKQVGVVAQPDRAARTIPDGYVSVDGAVVRIDAPASCVSESEVGACLLPWRVFDGDGVFVRLVVAENALEAAADLPAGHSVYVGGPSPQEPARKWWVDEWAACQVDPDDLIANDPRQPLP